MINPTDVLTYEQLKAKCDALESQLLAVREAQPVAWWRNSKHGRITTFSALVRDEWAAGGDAIGKLFTEQPAPAQALEVTDEMAMAFHRALTDSDIGSDDLDDIKIGLRGALCNYTAPPAPAVPEDITGIIKRFQHQCDHLSDWHHIDEHSCKVDRRDLMTVTAFLNACRTAMLSGGAPCKNE